MASIESFLAFLGKEERALRESERERNEVIGKMNAWVAEEGTSVVNGTECRNECVYSATLSMKGT